MTSLGNKFVGEAIARLVGKAPWGVRLGQGSFLTMEFGNPVTTDLELRMHGEWHLWLYMCNWRLETSTDVVAGSSDDRQQIETVLANIEWGTVVKATVTNPALDLLLSFDSGNKLSTFSSSSSEEDQWVLFTPDKKAITVNSNGLYDNEPSSAPDPPSK